MENQLVPAHMYTNNAHLDARASTDWLVSCGSREPALPLSPIKLSRGGGAHCDHSPIDSSKKKCRLSKKKKVKGSVPKVEPVVHLGDQQVARKINGAADWISIEYVNAPMCTCGGGDHPCCLCFEHFNFAVLNGLWLGLRLGDVNS